MKPYIHDKPYFLYGFKGDPEEPKKVTKNRLGYIIIIQNVRGFVK